MKWSDMTAEEKKLHSQRVSQYYKELKWKNPEQYEKVKVRNREASRKRLERIHADPVLHEKYKEYMRNYHKRKKEQQKIQDNILELTAQLELI